MKHLTAVVLFAAVAAAQDPPANPLVTVSKNIYGIAKNDILGSVNKIPDELWSFQPTKEVRTVAQLFAHGLPTPVSNEEPLLSRTDQSPVDGR